jgi:hypothetical protein
MSLWLIWMMVPFAVIGFGVVLAYGLSRVLARWHEEGDE